MRSFKEAKKLANKIKKQGNGLFSNYYTDTFLGGWREDSLPFCLSVSITLDPSEVQPVVDGLEEEQVKYYVYPSRERYDGAFSQSILVQIEYDPLTRGGSGTQARHLDKFRDAVYEDGLSSDQAFKLIDVMAQCLKGDDLQSLAHIVANRL